VLSKYYKLNLRKYQGFFAKSKKIHSEYFSLFFIKSDLTKVIVIIPKKAIKSAVERNNLKRKYYSVIENNWDYFEKSKLSLAIVVHNKGNFLDKNQIFNQIKTHVQKINN
jgi:ribonuclease P protein component